MDDAEQFMPTYLRFVKGIIDSNDLPLNVSREILQDSKITRDLRAGCVKRVLSTLSKLAKNKAEEYQSFWDAFGQILKEGPAEDMANKADIAKLLRFASTHNDDEKQTVSLEDYIGRMKEGQKKIYYVTGETFQAAKNSPHLEVFRKKGIEVLLLSERIDDWLMSHLTDFEEKQFQSITRGKLDLDELNDEQDKEKIEQTQKEFEGLINQIKESLGEKVKEVRITDRLTDSPACVVGDENDMGSQMAMLLKAAGQAVPESKPIFEINPEHTLIERLVTEQDDERFGQWVEVLFEQAVLAESGHLDDPAGFVGRLNKLLQQLSA
jgi:molecular chaperone HtpG